MIARPGAQTYVVGLEYSYEPGEHLGVNATLEGAQERAERHHQSIHQALNRREDHKPLAWSRSSCEDPNWTAYGTSSAAEYWISLEEVGP